MKNYLEQERSNKVDTESHKLESPLEIKIATIEKELADLGGSTLKEEELNQLINDKKKELEERIQSLKCQINEIPEDLLKALYQEYDDYNSFMTAVNERRSFLENKLEAIKIFSIIFNSNENGRDRLKIILDRVMPRLANMPDVDQEKVISEIKACENLDKDNFILRIIEILEFMIPKKSFGTQPERVGINGLTYGISGNRLHIHYSPIKAPGPADFKKYKKDFTSLAEILVAHPEVELITAHSWIVAKNPKLLESMGFEIEDDKWLDNEKREAAGAKMTREKFLDLYQSNNNN